ncbi:MAG: hypothetical protein IT370_31240, partial [Deltaproteobacteria bacterium]|nr:hypothetical protein [Deltaproteobacteria bacterium]
MAQHPSQELRDYERLTRSVVDAYLAAGRFPAYRAFQLAHENDWNTISDMLAKGFGATYTPTGEDRPLIRPTIMGLALLDPEHVRPICVAGDLLVQGMRAAFLSDDGDRRRWSIDELAAKAGTVRGAVQRAVPFAGELCVWASPPDVDGKSSGQLASAVMQCAAFTEVVAKMRERIKNARSSVPSRSREVSEQ